MYRFPNLDRDLKEQMVSEIDYEIFNVLPVIEQEKILEPYLRAQRERDRERLSWHKHPPRKSLNAF